MCNKQCGKETCHEAWKNNEGELLSFCDNQFQLSYVSFIEPHHKSKYHIPTDRRSKAEKSLYHYGVTQCLQSTEPHSLLQPVLHWLLWNHWWVNISTLRDWRKRQRRRSTEWTLVLYPLYHITSSLGREIEMWNIWMFFFLPFQVLID